MSSCTVIASEVADLSISEFTLAPHWLHKMDHRAKQQQWNDMGSTRASTLLPADVHAGNPTGITHCGLCASSLLKANIYTQG